MIETDNSTFKFKNSNNIEDILRQICDLVSFDIGLILMFDYNSKISRIISLYVRDNIDAIDKILIKKVLSDQEINDTVRLIVSSNKLLLRDYTLVDNDNCNKYIPLLKFAKKEIYIPLTIKDQLFSDSQSCIYLCSYNEKIKVETDKLDYSIISDKITEISLYIRYISERENKTSFLFNVSHLFSELVGIKDESIINHSFNVAYFTMMLAEKFQLTLEEKQKLFYASLFHDIGKIFIDDSILKKEGKLDDDELNQIRNHSLFGYSITSGMFCNINELKDIPIIIKYHHERIDGTGYPSKLKGEEIPFFSKLISVSDSIDAMLSRRVYRENKGINYVISELITNKDKQFDGKIVQAALEVLNNPIKFNQSNFLDTIMWCAITVHLKSGFKIIQGSIARRNGFYQFRYFSKRDMTQLDIKEVTKVELFIPVNIDVVEYETEVICITEEYAYFSEIKEKKNTDSFSVLWELKGKFSSNKSNFIVDIYKIGGSSLWFCVQDIRIENELKGHLNTIRVTFDDKSYIDVTGTIDNILKIGSNICCQFKYASLPENTRDKIFIQIFKKQRQLKNG